MHPRVKHGDSFRVPTLDSVRYCIFHRASAQWDLDRSASRSDPSSLSFQQQRAEETKCDTIRASGSVADKRRRLGSAGKAAAFGRVRMWSKKAVGITTEFRSAAAHLFKSLFNDYPGRPVGTYIGRSAGREERILMKTGGL